MSDASFTEEEEIQAYGGAWQYDVRVPVSVTVDFSETGLDWKDALRKAVREEVIEYTQDDNFGFEFTGPNGLTHGAN